MLKRYGPPTVRDVPEPFSGIYTHGTEVMTPKRLLFLSGQIGTAIDGTTAEGFAAQCHQAMDNVEALLAEAGLKATDILRVTYYLTQASDIAELTTIRQARWRFDAPPAVTTLVVAALATPDLLIEIEITAGI